MKKKYISWQRQAREIWATLDRIVKLQEEFAEDMSKLQLAQTKTTEEINKITAEINKITIDISKLKENIDGISKGFGRITQGMTLPCVEKAFSVVGIEVYGTEECVKKEIEIDILTTASKEGKELIGAIAYVHDEMKAIHFAQTKKIYIISIGDDIMELKNPQIIPRIYKFAS